jgi:hypothetical protein
VTEADIMSICEVVWVTELACSLADCDRDWAVALTWLAAPVSALAAARTSSITAVSLLVLSQEFLLLLQFRAHKPLGQP